MSYVLRRLLSAIPVVMIVTVAVFFFIHLTPGDPALLIAGETASPAELERIRQNLGLDRPLVEQFMSWVVRILQGNFGVSIYSGLPVSTLILQRIEPTLSVAFIVIVMSSLIAVPLGVFSAFMAGRWPDRLMMALAVFCFSMPVFLVGYFLSITFGSDLGWFPVQGYRPLSSGLGNYLYHLTLPCLAITALNVAYLTRMTRASMMEVLNQDYIRTARSKGLALNKVLFRHALGNAAVPIVTAIGISFTGLIGGVVITETVFALPGIGRLLVESIHRHDYPVVQGITLLFSFVYLGINLLVDLTYPIFDPRITR
jgi:peptide/nickel transport system permease protein